MFQYRVDKQQLIFLFLSQINSIHVLSQKFLHPEKICKITRHDISKIIT
jgi:hypothetical protein